MGDGWQAMMKFFIHYRASDGVIIGWGNSFEPEAIEGYAIAVFDEPFEPPSAEIKIAGGKLVKMSAAEIARANAPTKEEMKARYSPRCRRAGSPHAVRSG